MHGLTPDAGGAEQKSARADHIGFLAQPVRQKFTLTPALKFRAGIGTTFARKEV
jgi:hypothetical protein